ncbi:MAG: hypothetical protein WD055_02175 [Candidatus Dependentiae bacterium]
MEVIAFLLIIFWSSLFYAADTDGVFSDQQREEAQQFINESFSVLKQRLEKSAHHILAEEHFVESKANEALKQAESIDYNALSTLDKKRIDAQNALYEAKKYENSLKQPQKEMQHWDKEHEKSAHALKAFMQLTDAWVLYEADPTDMKVYAMLHKYIQKMAVNLTDKPKVSQSFVGGGYDKDDKKNNYYDVDRIFFLTLYLLDKDLQEA